jgi:hypothetical protein
MNEIIEAYEGEVQGLRQGVLASPAVRSLLDPEIDPLVLERFLIEWCALGVQVTRPVEGWIRRAGERTTALGLGEVGAALIKHAKHEAGHDEMFVHDAHALVDRWNARHAPRLDAEALMAKPATPGMRRYIELHEDVIASAAPYAQVAIEYEVEGLSVRLLPPLFAQFRKVLGPEILEVLTFLTEHAEIDVGHTAYNRRLMTTLLGARPEARSALVDAGTAAVNAYLDFLGECLAVAKAEARQARTAVA